MSTTFLATPLPEPAAVLLEVTGAGAGALVVTRTDVNGSRPVRLLPDQAPIGGVLTVRDYEPALVGPITYTLEGSAGEVLTQTVTLGLDRPVVSVPVRPARRVDGAALVEWGESSAGGSIIHWIPDREDPIVVSGPLRTRTGAGALRVPSYADAVALRELFRAGDVVLVRQGSFPGLDAYLVADPVAAVPVDAGDLDLEWDVRITYTEVSAPAGPLEGAADWTLRDIAGVGTLADIAAAFPTLRALAVGP